MPTSLDQLAERAQDLYYQDYAPRDKFFDVEDFKFHAAAYYSTALNTLYQIAKKENKSQDGFTNMEASAAWLMPEVLPVQKDDDGFFLQPSSGIFSFDFDAFANGLNGLRATGKSCNGRKTELIKLSNNEVRFLSLSPETSIVYYWLAPGNKIRTTCDVKEAEIWYIPTVVNSDGNCLLSDNIVSDVIKSVLTIMFGAKSGNVIQEANDGNKNLNPNTQTNPALTKNLQD